MPTFSMNVSKFNGIVPRSAPKLLPDNAAKTAQNCKLLSGRLEPIKAIPAASDGSCTSGHLSIFKWHRNASSEWLSFAPTTDVVHGPLKDDSKSRIYFHDSGVLKVTAWHSGAKVTRTVGGAQATKPTITSTPVNAYIFNPATGANQLTCSVKTTNTISWGTNNATDAGTLDKYWYDEDGKFHVIFSFPERRYPAITTSPGSHWASYSWNSRPTPQLSLAAAGGGTPLTSLPAAMGSAIEGESVSLTSGGTAYGTFQVEKVIWQGRSVQCLDSDTGRDSLTGLPSGNSALFTVSDYTIEFIVDMNYTTFAGPGAQPTAFCYYVQTYVDDWGEEGPASDVSNMVKLFPGQIVQLALGADPGGNVTTRRLYRSAAGTSEDAFFYVADIAAATTTYSDSKSDAALGEELDIITAPPTDFAGLSAMPGGFLAGFANRTLYFSEPWKPYSWPTEYRLSVDYDIVALAATETDLVVLTKGLPYIITGSAPDNLTQQIIGVNQSCIARRSVAVMRNAVIYASPDGLVLLQHGQGQLITEKYYRRADWDALTPSSCFASVYNKTYYAWLTGANIIFDFDEGLGAVTTHNIAATTAFTDIEADTMYIVEPTTPTAIKAWEGGTANSTITWRSKEFEFLRRIAPNSARIISSVYPVTLTLYTNEGSVAVATVSVASASPVRIPILRAERVWSWQIAVAGNVDAVFVGTSMESVR